MAKVENGLDIEVDELRSLYNLRENWTTSSPWLPSSASVASQDKARDGTFVRTERTAAFSKRNVDLLPG